MKEIKCLIEIIEEELDGADHYAELYHKYSASDRQLSETFKKVAQQELDHVHMFHDQAARLIREYPKDPPEAMKAIWEWEHDKMIEQEKEVRILLDM